MSLDTTDMEQRKLYEAAKVIQSAYRQYRDKQCKQQNKEIEAAILIQSYYRRYKQVHNYTSCPHNEVAEGIMFLTGRSFRLSSLYNEHSSNYYKIWYVDSI